MELYQFFVINQLGTRRNRLQCAHFAPGTHAIDTLVPYILGPTEWLLLSDPYPDYSSWFWEDVPVGSAPPSGMC